MDSRGNSIPTLLDHLYALSSHPTSYHERWNEKKDKIEGIRKEIIKIS